MSEFGIPPDLLAPLLLHGIASNDVGLAMLTSLHVPRLQVPVSAVRGRERERLARLNAELSTTHEHVQSALRALDSAAEAFSDPLHVPTHRVGYTASTHPTPSRC